MNYQIKSIIPILCLVAALLPAALRPSSGYCENLRFVFLADSRGSSTTDLINTTVLTAINNQILALSPRPAFVMFGGDQAYRGCVNGTYSFQAFKDAMAPLTNAGIPLYTVIGNHELTNSADDGITYRRANQTAYQQAFSSNPANGPPGYEQLVYSFTSPGGDAFFAVMDPYYLTADVVPTNLTGTFDDTELNWLAAQVAQTKATHKFLFNHGPYYYVAPSQPLPPDKAYTKLWSILDNNRFDLYGCGHLHLFARMTIDSSVSPIPQLNPPVQWRNHVVQLLTGTCGAQVESAFPFIDRQRCHINDAPDTYYFSVVDISGSRVTVNSYGGNTRVYTVIDSFTINKGAVPATSLLLLE